MQIRLDPEVAAALEAEANERDVSVAKLANRKLREQIEQEDGPAVSLTGQHRNARVTVAGVRHRPR